MNYFYSNTLRIHAVTVGLIMLAIFNAGCNQKPTSNEIDEVKNELLLKNEILPSKIDEDTELLRISIKSKHVIYDYKFISKTVENISYELFSYWLDSTMVEEVCADKKLVILIDNGLTVTYKYYDKNDGLISDKTISSRDCVELKNEKALRKEMLTNPENFIYGYERLVFETSKMIIFKYLIKGVNKLESNELILFDKWFNEVNLPNICNDKSNQILFDSGYTLSFAYFNQKKKFLVEYVINNKRCNQYAQD